MIPAKLAEGIEAMSERIEALEAENLILRKDRDRLTQEKELCIREVMRYKMLLDAARRKDGGTGTGAPGARSRGEGTEGSLHGGVGFVQGGEGDR